MLFLVATPDNIDNYLQMTLEVFYGSIFGAISIRHCLTEDLENYGEHIGYGIRPSERNKGYATLMLKLALEKAKELNIDKVLIHCGDDNIVSSKVIAKNGGCLEFDGYYDKLKLKIRRLFNINILKYYKLQNKIIYYIL
jgi:predicted acetyltransferase